MKDADSLLQGKMVLVVDDEPDILETVAEILSMCTVHKASDFDTADQYLASYTYDIVILDIMGVNGFELLRNSVERGFPTVMLTAHALTPEALKKSIKLGAVFFLPKDKLGSLKGFLEEIVAQENKPIWHKFFETMSDYLDRKFGPGWKERDSFFKDLEREVMASNAK